MVLSVRVVYFKRTHFLAEEPSMVLNFVARNLKTGIHLIRVVLELAIAPPIIRMDYCFIEPRMDCFHSSWVALGQL